MKRRGWRSLLIALVMLLQLVPVSVQAQSGSIEAVVLSAQTETVLATFSSLEEAADYFEEHRQEDDGQTQLGLRQDGRWLALEQGIVFFSSPGCTVNTEYINLDTGESGYLNGCYGADGAYLGSDLENGQIRFEIAGVRGRVSAEAVTLVPLSQAGNLSCYTLHSGRLVHQLRESLSSSRYSTMIDLGEAPVALQSYSTLYSYDGHYFYEDAAVMLQDAQAGSTASSVNPSEPFYFYYQYLPHRSLTWISAEQLESYFQDALGIDKTITTYRDRDRNSVHDTLNQSLYYQQASAFFEAQHLYGSNAMMMLALSMNETASGRSSLSFTRNNLFGHAAYDSDVEANARRYFQLSGSILAHAKSYVSGSYLNPSKFQYHGGFFGDKASGMNVSYASDPYWGEKAASYYMKVDEALGSQDRDRLALGLHTEYESLSVMQQPSAFSSVLYTTGKSAPLSFVLLEKVENEEGTWYKIQSEAALAEDYSYRFEECVGYLPASAFQLIMGADKMGSLSYQSTVFDAGEGTFTQGGSQIVVDTLVGTQPHAPVPTKPGSVFAGWQDQGDGVQRATYRIIDHLEMVTLPPVQLALGARIDLSGGVVRVFYQDGTSEDLSLTTSMVSGFDMNQEGEQQVTVSVGTVSTAYGIMVSDQINVLQDSIIAEMQTLTETAEPSSLSESQRQALAVQKERFDQTPIQSLTWTQIRLFDALLNPLLQGQRSLVLQSQDPGFAVSGLSLAVRQENPGARRWLKETIRLRWKENTLPESLAQQVSRISKDSGSELCGSFVLEGWRNFNELSLQSALVVTVSLPQVVDSSQKVTVWRLQDGDVIQMPTQQSASTLTFQTEELGQFVVVSTQTANRYEEEAPTEVMTMADNGVDWTRVILAALIVLAGLLILLIAVLLHHRRKTRRQRLAAERRRRYSRRGRR